MNSAIDTAQHTPGPWEYVFRADDEEHRLIGVDDYTGIYPAYQIASIYPATREVVAVIANVDAAEANARLIAAAPELLAALEACDEYLGSPANQAFGSYDGDIAGIGHLQQQARAAIALAKAGA